MDDQFTVSVTHVNGTTTVFVTGELDIATSPELRAALNHVDGPLVFDLGQLTFIDAIGIEELLRAADGNDVEIRGASPFVRRVFALVDLGHLVSPEAVR